MEIQASDKGIILKFGSSITFNSIKENRRTLEKVLKLNQKIFLHADNLEKIDSAGLQLLVIFVKTLNQNNLPYTWEKASMFLIKSAKLLGMDNILGLDQKIVF